MSLHFLICKMVSFGLVGLIIGPIWKHIIVQRSNNPIIANSESLIFSGKIIIAVVNIAIVVIRHPIYVFRCIPPI